MATPKTTATPETMASLGYRASNFSSDKINRQIFDKGAGPRVLVMHELPGLARPAVNFAERLISAGFHVFMPLLIGKPLERDALGNSRRLCISEEFARLEAGVSAPITNWLRALARDMAGSSDLSKIGVIGMCLTGAFVIPLIIEPCVQAGVVSQPAIPYRVAYRLLGVGGGEWMEQLNIADDELDQAARCAREQRKFIMIQRFEDDRLCPRARVDRIAIAFGEQAKRFHYPETSWWRRTFDPPHAVLTEEYDRTAEPAQDHPTRIALRRVVAFLHDNLAPVPPPSSPQSRAPVHGVSGAA